MDPDKIKGDVQRPYNAPEEKTPDKVDPEKFKKVMKVDESDETQKRKKRNLPKEEEEGADEEVQEQAPPQSPVTSFSEFMSDKEQLDNVFNKESGGIRRQAAPQEGTAFTAPPSGSISTEGVDLDQESEPPPTSSGYASGAPSQTQEGATQQPPPAQPQQPSTSGEYQQPRESSSNQPPSFFQGNLEQPNLQQPSQAQQPEQSQTGQEQTTPTQETQQVEKKEEEPKKEKKEEQDTSLLASQPKTKDLKALKKKGPKGIAPEVKIVPGKEPLEKKGEPVEQKVTDNAPEKFEEGIVPPPKEKKEGPIPQGEDLTGAAETEQPSIKRIPLGEELPKEKTEEESLKEETFAGIKEGPAKEMARGPSPFKRFSPQEARTQKMGKEGQAAALEGLPVPRSSEGEQGEMGGRGKKKDEDSFLEANSQTAGIPLPTFENPFPAIVPSEEIPAYSKLSADVHELFEKMGGVIMIQQDKGITTTTMNINMPGSVFDGTQVILDRYSTAPNSYNIQLVGNPDSVKIFNQNLDALKESFKQANFNFETNILNPILTTSKKSPHLIRRAKGAGDKGGGGGKGNK
ncbi:MAG: hypothetical protein KDK96_04810 [Chlamydiia bacterium]|nr:hypothetical protein [Chlamydiia bacterium]